MRDLDRALRVHDLPVSWDGRPVVWGRWIESTEPTHLPEDVCEKCGVLGPQRHAFGRRQIGRAHV